MVEVSNFLGYYASPILLSRLVKHPNIPVWSRCKPVAYNRTIASKTTQAEQESWFDSIGWGYNMKSVLPMNTDAETYSSAITLSQEDVWEYSGCTPTENLPGRLADFRWCNGDAEIPFLPVELYYYDPGIEYHRGPTIQLKWARNLNQNSEINPYNYNALRQGDYHILLRKLGATTGTTMLSTGVTETFTAMTTSNITMESGDTGTYEVCAAIQKYGGNHEVYPLPGTYTKFTVRNRTEEEYLGLSLTNQCSMRLVSATGWLTVRMKLTNLTNEAITASVGCEVYDSRNTMVWQKLNHSVTVPANGSITLYGKTDPEAFVTTDPGEIKVEDVGAQGQFRPPITADCKVTRLGITMTKSATILNS